MKGYYMEVWSKISVSTPGQAIEGIVTSVSGNMVGVILQGQQCETMLFIDEINLERNGSA